MEQVIDKLISELTSFSASMSADGGCADVMKIEAIYFGDPGVIPERLYPAVFVQALRDVPSSETTGYEVRTLQIAVTFVIDAREFFDSTVDEASGDRAMTQVVDLFRNWIRRTSNRSLDSLDGVREVSVPSTDYFAQKRGSVVAKTAQLTLNVSRRINKHA